MKKAVLFLLLLHGCSWAQFSNTVIAPSTVPDALLPNIGQNVHTYTVATHGASCNGTAQAVLQGIFTTGTSTVYTQAPQQIVSAIGAFGGNNIVRTYVAAGAFSGLRVHLTASDLVNCTYTISYSGVVGGSATLPVPSTATGLLNFYVHSAASGTTHLLGSFSADYYFGIYGFQLCNTASGQTVTLQDTNGVKFAVYAGLQAGQCIVYPLSQNPVFDTSLVGATSLNGPHAAGAGLDMVLANATAVDVYYWYQVE